MTFFKGVNPRFWYKNGHSLSFFLGNIGQEKVFYDILERKNALLGSKNKKCKKSKNWHFFQKPMVLVQKWPFFQLFSLGNIRQENVFYDILELKNAFLGFKNKQFKRSKNWHFSKGVNQRFWSKNGHFSAFFFLGNIGQENVFYNILERKKAFLAYKHKKFKKSKNWDFSKGVNSRFWSKNGHFSNFFFLGNIGQENVFYDILERKNAFLRYKNKEVQKVKKLTFFPRG